MSVAADEFPPLFVDTIRQIVDPKGNLVGPVPDLPNEKLLQIYRWMVFGRVSSNRMVALQRQGRMGTFAEVNGQEAVCVGMAAPLRQKDWLLGSWLTSMLPEM